MAGLKALNVGFSNIVSTEKIVAIIQADSASGKRLRTEAKKIGKLVDATQGRRTRSIIIAESGHLILSALRVESLTRRIETEDNSIAREEEESNIANE